ncbi:hypothetical protein M9H77_18983 [Catharanthus roseus]|uniref:Uncharacterized protein n=1 Tax=Catharanthus roseus TaxID=4058 RepID=A0ACC0B930_CATRO|nr:hypothetical protein M9H77_18983 [Catharanthus roseus]
MEGEASSDGRAKRVDSGSGPDTQLHHPRSVASINSSLYLLYRFFCRALRPKPHPNLHSYQPELPNPPPSDVKSSLILNVFSSLLTPADACPSGLMTFGVYEIWQLLNNVVNYLTKYA